MVIEYLYEGVAILKCIINQEIPYTIIQKPVFLMIGNRVMNDLNCTKSVISYWKTVFKAKDSSKKSRISNLKLTAPSFILKYIFLIYKFYPGFSYKLD